MKLNALIIAALSVTGACTQAFAFADPPVSEQPASEQPAAVQPPSVQPASDQPSVTQQDDDTSPADVPVNVVSPAPSDVVVERTARPTITFAQRLSWFDQHTFGVPNLLGSIPGAALDTGLNHPHEAGPHWSGFGERYGVSVSTNGLSNAIEASLGAAWGEDPRYFRAGEAAPFKSRIGHIVKWTFVATDRDGVVRPAYARYAAYTSSSFISDAWREPSDTSIGNEIGRIGLAFAGHMAGNAFEEFWPDAKRKLFHKAPRD